MKWKINECILCHSHWWTLHQDNLWHNMLCLHSKSSSTSCCFFSECRSPLFIDHVHFWEELLSNHGDCQWVCIYGADGVEEKKTMKKQTKRKCSFDKMSQSSGKNHVYFGSKTMQKMENVRIFSIKKHWMWVSKSVSTCLPVYPCPQHSTHPYTYLHKRHSSCCGIHSFDTLQMRFSVSI